MSNQLRTPLLTVAPKPQPAPDCGMAPVTPEVEAHMAQMARFEVEQRRARDAASSQSTVAKGAEGETFAETLAGFRGSYPPAMSIAATLFRSHGEMARQRHAWGIKGEWSPTEKRIDALLSMAGVPEAVQLGLAK